MRRWIVEYRSGAHSWEGASEFIEFWALTRTGARGLAKSALKKFNEDDRVTVWKITEMKG